MRCRRAARAGEAGHRRRAGSGPAAGVPLASAPRFAGFALGGVGFGWFAGGALVGHLLGRGVTIARCSACATVVDVRATSCRTCGAVFRGDISSLAQRLEAEERLGDAGDPP